MFRGDLRLTEDDQLLGRIGPAWEAVLNLRKTGEHRDRRGIVVTDFDAQLEEQADHAVVWHGTLAVEAPERRLGPGPELADRLVDVLRFDGVVTRCPVGD